jgi:polyisoprenoid-binding protein YceI
MIPSAFAFLTFSGAVCPSAPPTLREYTVDYGHTIVEFSIKFAFSRVKGRFTAGKGAILYDESNPSNSSITMVFESKSIDTGWGNRDRHLRTSDFFDVEKYPTIEFQSRRLVQTRGGWTAEGDLTMRGVTRRITMPFEFLQPPVRNPTERWMVMNLGGTIRLARADFGITGGSTYNSWFDNAKAATMGDSVDVSFEVEGYSPDAATQRPPAIEGWIDSIKTKGVQWQIARLTGLKSTKSADEFARYYRGTDLLVRALIGSCRLPDAVALANSMTGLFPASHGARLINGFVLDVSGDKSASAGEYAKARELFRAPVRDPNEPFPQDDPEWWYMDQLARAALEWGYGEQAVSLARVLTELYPQTARAFTTYGKSLARTGDRKAAATAYERALQVDPRETRALEWKRRS